MKKVCSRCHIEKEISEFGIQSKRGDGHRGVCKKCFSTRTEDEILQREENDALFIHGLKKCIKCGEIKDVACFKKSKRHRNGLFKVCKKCSSCLTEDSIKKKEEAQSLFNEGYKVCSICGETKPINSFYHRNKKRNDVYSYSAECHKCKYKRDKPYKQSDAYINRQKELRLEHLDEIHKTVNERNKRNREKLTAHKKQRERENPCIKIASTLRSRIWDVLIRRKRCTKKWFGFWDVVGCSPDELRRHLESQFRDGMSWANHSRNGWHIDHIIPCASFDLTDPEQQKQCFHYTNLQPLWWYENISKGAKIVA